MNLAYTNGLILPQSGHEITDKEEMSYEDGGWVNELIGGLGFAMNLGANIALWGETFGWWSLSWVGRLAARIVAVVGRAFSKFSLLANASAGTIKNLAGWVIKYVGNVAGGTLAIANLIADAAHNPIKYHL